MVLHEGLVKRVLAMLARRTAAVAVNDYLNSCLAEAFRQSHAHILCMLLLALGSVRLSFGREFWKARNSPSESREELQLVPSAAERSEATLVAVHELYMVDPALVARVLPNLQADLVNHELREHAFVCFGGGYIALQSTAACVITFHALMPAAGVVSLVNLCFQPLYDLVLMYMHLVPDRAQEQGCESTESGHSSCWAVARLLSYWCLDSAYFGIFAPLDCGAPQGQIG